MNRTWKRQIVMGLIVGAMIITLPGCNRSDDKDKVSSEVVGETEDSTVTAEKLLGEMTLEEKANQMLQGAVFRISEESMKKDCYGSVLSMWDGMDNSAVGWQKLILGLQKAAVGSSTGIPILYGNDAVHGVNECRGAVIFPHNIGVGAANDEKLTAEMGKVVANEIKLTGMLWTFSPCVAVATDPRWGRTYESYSSEVDRVTKLSCAFTKELVDNGVVACAKHFLGDGSARYGTGEGSNIIDRGDAALSDKQTKKLLASYKKLIDSGVQSIMISHSSVNGVKMHENKHLITDVLKGQLGFQGVVISDWESIHNISGSSLKSKVIRAVNSGIDMLMEPESYKKVAKYIVEGVEEGSIDQSRIDDAVLRILKMKEDAGVLSDPFMKKVESEYKNVSSNKAKNVARKMVEESLVKIKNKDKLLPLEKGTKIYVCGPAANDTGVDCGGWTISWGGKTDAENGSRYVGNGTTILDGFKKLAQQYDLTIITDKAKAKEADVTVLCLGEKPYAEWEGDTKDLKLIGGALSLSGNTEAAKEAKALGHKTVTLIVAGRNVLLDDEYYDSWDSVVMCYLPGSEADGVANVMMGKSDFKGTLPMPWYENVKDIKTSKVRFKVGYSCND